MMAVKLKRNDFRWISKETVERMAYILGIQSAAQHCLDKAKYMNRPVFFIDRDTMVVMDFNTVPARPGEKEE